MKLSQLIELAQKHGVDVGFLPFSETWYADVLEADKQLKKTKKLNDLIKFLSDNNIKINN